jgi:hypothetical protein
MTIFTYTIFNIVVIETVFFVAEKIISKRRLVSGFVTSFILGLIVLNFSFAGALASLFTTMAQSGNNFNLFQILLFFFNMFYGFWRGIGRIASINKKYGNL